jgi:metal-dependent amidase/aminoacylase/carboxypeptidase family protein
VVHPGPMDVVDRPTLAWASLEVTYHGKESHASMAPHVGLNAVDALNISYVAIAALRQHIRQTERIHGIVTHGGDAPNIVRNRTTAAYFCPGGKLRGAAVPDGAGCPLLRGGGPWPPSATWK